jgi:hypothetical protein
MENLKQNLTEEFLNYQLGQYEIRLHDQHMVMRMALQYNDSKLIDECFERIDCLSTVIVDLTKQISYCK